VIFERRWELNLEFAENEKEWKRADTSRFGLRSTIRL